MLRIGLMSDTHGFVNPKIKKHFAEVDEIWHAGDIGGLDVIDELKSFKPLRIVYGNIDSGEVRRETPEELSFDLEGFKVCITHIAGRPGKYVPKAFSLVQREKPTIFICGHSHILLAQKDPIFGHLHLNPGACGQKGFHQVCTLMRFSLNQGKIENMDVIELGNRV
jgi:putative phosphoesterase